MIRDLILKMWRGKGELFTILTPTAWVINPGPGSVSQTVMLRMEKHWKFLQYM